MTGNGVVVVSGVAPHSLGESLAPLLAKQMACGVICIDLQVSSALDMPGCKALEISLDPFDHHGAGETLFEKLVRELDLAVSGLCATHIQCLVQSAGVYWSGRFLDSTAEIRQRIAGVNVCGRLELLAAVLAVNERRGVPSNEVLSHFDVGSIYALEKRGGRALYDASKSFGVALSRALAAGNELKSANYFAPGPIDTHMLHLNHWVIKSGGSPDFIALLKRGGGSTYDAILVHCSEAAFRDLVGLGSGRDTLETFRRYCSTRRAAQIAQHGVLGRAECAEVLQALVTSPASERRSGIQTVVRPLGGGVQCSFMPFEGHFDLRQQKSGS